MVKKLKSYRIQNDGKTAFCKRYYRNYSQQKEAAELMKQRDEVADIDFVKIDYATFAAKNPVKVTTEDLANYIKNIL